MITDASHDHTGKMQQGTRAWLTLLLLPVSFVVAMVAGEGIASLVVKSETETAPIWLMIVVLVVAVAIFALPLIFTARYSKRGVVAGESGARLPLIMGLIVVGAFALLNIVSGVMILIFG